MPKASIARGRFMRPLSGAHTDAEDPDAQRHAARSVVEDAQEDERGQRKRGVTDEVEHRAACGYTLANAHHRMEHSRPTRPSSTPKLNLEVHVK